MSTSGTTSVSSPTTITGLASGLDTSSIITNLVNNESTINNSLITQVSSLQSQLSAWQTFNADLIGLQTASSALSAAKLYSGVTATSSDTSVAGATASTGAAVGSHTLVVNTLAASQEVLSSAFDSSTTAAGATGTIALNGKQIAVTSSETLTQIAAAINTAGAGVTASVLNIGTGDTKLALTATGTGTINGITASDVGSGNALETLGLVSSSATTDIRQLTSSNGNSIAGSMVLTSGTSAIGTQLGYASGAAASGSFSITTSAGTANVTGIDLNTMSLTQIATAINADAGTSGITAQVVPSTASGTSSGPEQLQIVSSSGTLTSSDFSDPNGILSSIGVTQKAFTTQATQATDANFTLDDVTYSRSSNTVTDALPDTSLTLSDEGTTNVSVSQDTSAIDTAMQSFVSAYNTVNDYITTQFTYTPNTSSETSGTAQTSPALFGDQTLSNTQQQLADAVNVSTGGISLATVGLTVGTTGDLSLDTDTLNSEISTNSTGVANLFGQSGSTTNSAVQYVTGTTSTLPTALGYAVNITQPATQAVVTAKTASAATLPSAETLSFSGTLFPNSTVSITLNSGNTLAQSIAQINTDSQLDSLLTASQDSSGDLVLSSTAYGASQGFTVVSNVASGGTGIGSSTVGADGTDVAGTINGEAATGLGQTLIGNSGNKNTDGLELNVTATTAGSYGDVLVSSGIGTGLSQLIANITNATTGAITSAESNINSEISSDQTQETTNNTTIATYKAQLETEFANMETQVASLQAQSTAMNAEIAGAAGTTTSSSSSTKSASTGTTSSSS
jgi:flagellar hook-associated protein 2